ncbi:MAG: hypothetical protein ACYDAE_09600 [Steroidobacteraceae bacterium]
MSRGGDGEYALGEITEPAFFTDETLQGIYEVNHLLLELLVAAASRPASETRPQLVSALVPALLGLGAAAQEHLARCPVALVDLEFRNVEWWRQIECGQGALATLHSSPGCFPRLQAMQLAQATLTLAWSAVRSNRETATIVFGLAPECAARLAGLGVPAIQRLAEAHGHCIRPRWEADATFWCELLRIAQATDSSAPARLPPIAQYVLSRQFAELVPLLPRLATAETATTRASRR